MDMTAIRRAAGVVVMAMVLAAPVGRSLTVHAQSSGSQPTAEFTRGEFRSLMQKYPPALGRILVLDPTLLTSESYLKAYPALQQYLTQHPEIARDPRYFLADYLDGAQRTPVDPSVQASQFAVNAWRNMIEVLMVFVGFCLFVFALGWLIRYVVDHRRWLRASKVQSDTHAKLLERFTSTEDLKAYMQSEAGQSFLNASPLSTVSVAASAPVGAPFNRILWSVQVGVVSVALGIGLLVISWRQEHPEVSQMIGAWGTLAIAVGIGFAIAAGASYLLSQRLGLLDSQHEPRTR